MLKSVKPIVNINYFRYLSPNGKVLPNGKKHNCIFSKKKLQKVLQIKTFFLSFACSEKDTCSLIDLLTQKHIGI